MSSIITDPQILANFSDAIESVLDNYNLGSVKRDYIRETILGRLEYEWKASPRFRSDIGSISDPDDQKRVIFSIVTQVAKTEIEAETRNLQVEAEKKIIAEAIKGNYFKKGGVKKAISDIGDWFGPFGRSVRKLSELKKDADPDALRDTILDVIFPETQKGLKGVQSLFGQYSPEDDIELKASLVDTAIDVAFGKTIETKPRTLGFDSVNAIKVAYDKSLDKIYDTYREQGKTKVWLDEEIQKLKSSTKERLDAVVREVNDHVIEENRRNISGQFFDPKRAKFVGIAEATSFERKEGPPRFSVFSYEFDDRSHNLRIVDEVEDFYQEGVSQFLNVSPLTFVSKSTDQLKHTEALAVLRDLEIQGFRDFDFQNQGTDFYNQLEKNYFKYKEIVTNNPASPREVVDYFNSLEAEYKKIQIIRENAPSITASQVFSDVQEFKDLVNITTSNPTSLTAAQQTRLQELRDQIKRHSKNNLIDLSGFTTSEIDSFTQNIDRLDFSSAFTLQATSQVIQNTVNPLIDQGVLIRFGGNSGNDFVEFDSYVRKLINDNGRVTLNDLTAEERVKFDSLKLKVDAHLSDPAYSGLRGSFNLANTSGVLRDITRENSQIVSTRFTNRSSHHIPNLGFSVKDALNLHLGDLDSLLSTGPGVSTAFPLLKKPFEDFKDLIEAARVNDPNFTSKKDLFYDKYVRDSKVFTLSSTLRSSLASATSIADFNSLMPQIRSEVLSQYIGAPAKDLFALTAFMNRVGVADFLSLTDAQKKEFLELKNRVLSHLNNGVIAYTGISNVEISNLQTILNDSNPSFNSFMRNVDVNFKERIFNDLLAKPQMFHKSIFKDVPGFTGDLAGLLDLVYFSSDFAGLVVRKPNGQLDFTKQKDLEKLVDKIKAQLTKLDADGKYPLLNIDPDFKASFISSLDAIKSGNFDDIRSKLIQLQSLSLYDQALQSKEVLFKKLAKNKDFQEILKKQRALSNALAVVNSMQSFKRLKPEDLALFEEYKRQLIRDLDLFGFTPAEITEITNALNSNNYIVIKRYFSAGAFGNKKIDLFSEQLNKDLLKIAHSTGDRKFANAITRRILNSQITQSFVGRKMFEQLITGAQMATDYKFFKQEVKRTLQTLVLNSVSSRWKSFLDNRVSNSAARNFIDNVVNLLREADKQKNPAKYFWKKFKTEVVDTFAASFIKKRFERYLKFKIFNKRYTLDPTQLITNPIKYLSVYGKDILFREAKNLVYRKIILKYFKKNKYVKWYKVFRFKLARIKIRYNSILDQFMANPFKFIGENATKGLEFLWIRFSRYFPAVASRLATFVSRFGFLRALSFASLTNPVGWAVMVVVFVGPILLKPFFGNIDYFESLKRMLLFCCLLPFIFIFIIIFVPILVLFNFAGSVWDAITSTIGAVFDWNISNVLDSDKNWSNLGDPYKNSINYRASSYTGDFFLGGISGGLGGISYLTNLLNNNGGHCFQGNNLNLRYSPKISGWMNVDLRNNELLKEADNDVSFSILCSASYHLSQVYPGRTGSVSCHAGQPTFFDGRGGYTDRYWCTRIVVDSMVDLKTKTNDPDYNANTYGGYYSGLKERTSRGKYIEFKIDYDSNGWSNQCLPINTLNKLSGAVAIFNNGWWDACDPQKMAARGNVDHVGLYLKMTDTHLHFIQTNAGFIKDDAPRNQNGKPCTYNGTINGQQVSEPGIRISYWSQADKGNQWLCGIYFPNPGNNANVLPVLSTPPSSIEGPLPYKNNSGERVCPIPSVNNTSYYRR